MPDGLRKIQRALISVSDKSGIVEFAQELQRLNIEIISTGGTAQTLRNAGLEVNDISSLTGFPEMMDGRVKTLHPRVHGGLLAIRNNPEHVAAMEAHDIKAIDMVVVNLYPFQETIKRPGVTRAEAIEQIDIGGPAMIRSAAKNADDVAVIVSTGNYQKIVAELRETGGELSLKTRRDLARDAFKHTAAYDTAVSAYLSETSDNADATTSLPDQTTFSFTKITDLRYGENPHQLAALYRTSARAGLANAEILSGKEMSFNNYIDAEAAWQLVADFKETACAIIKHTNPAGVGLGTTPAEAYQRALATDPISAFGGIVAFNRTVDLAAAQEATKIFTEVVIAPAYDSDALETFKTKKNLRVLKMSSTESTSGLEYKQISGGMLIQTKDTHQLNKEDLKVVTIRPPTDEEIDALLFAWIVSKHTKSNAIVYARKDQTVGVGAGQMSRVDSVKIGAMRAQLPVAGSVLASDAFFPFRDGLDEAAKHGITAIIQPGGSVRDDEVIAAANEHGIAMVFTGIRHFKH
ncbi:MAG TPA: bifunctional phosphoribosylaminoimidazolecarboxamide formyltransferase/IMP cyclohydrolase [Pyrinomonadaceae bacterium]